MGTEAPGVETVPRPTPYRCLLGTTSVRGRIGVGTESEQRRHESCTDPVLDLRMAPGRPPEQDLRTWTRYPDFTRTSLRVHPISTHSPEPPPGLHGGASGPVPATPDEREPDPKKKGKPRTMAKRTSEKARRGKNGWTGAAGSSRSRQSEQSRQSRAHQSQSGAHQSQSGARQSQSGRSPGTGPVPRGRAPKDRDPRPEKTRTRRMNP